MFSKISVFKRQQGVSLLELMLSLAIIAVILTMATKFYQQTSEARKNNEAYQALVALKAAVDNWKAANPGGNMSNLNNTTLGGFYPQSYFIGDFVFSGAKLSLTAGQGKVTGLGETTQVCEGLKARLENLFAPYLDEKKQPQSALSCSGGDLTIDFTK